MNRNTHLVRAQLDDPLVPDRRPVEHGHLTHRRQPDLCRANLTVESKRRKNGPFPGNVVIKSSRSFRAQCLSTANESKQK